ncbi:ASKHA domain-containing protein [Anaeromicropila herbilytica]|uniref:2Fe-2S ferredoxin-type domain-containing protein n=1 Tax=Anaeromicropila herbilytica TaxID=2785025 RepID=A0A7R7EQF4_9FIRM|nr:ASKHA domain-containing protein [Anaeromicropila herbilytica]BCN32855.1 hypothetical protein bsdtb5_41500 [Anaeromicropila herbilytica]
MKITFIPENKLIIANEQETILQVARRVNIPIEATCSGQGTCGKCKVKILSGRASSLSKAEKELLTQEEYGNGTRLACKVYAKDDFIIERINNKNVNVRKAVTTVLPEDFNLMPRYHQIKNTIAKYDNAKQIEQSKEETQEKVDETCHYGIAFDIGTTSVVGLLWNLDTGEQRGIKSKVNPQRIYGADVISRIQYSTQSIENQKELQQLIVYCCEAIILELIQIESIHLSKVCDVVVVGNTTMSHLFLGESVEGLARAPFQSSYQGMVHMQAYEIFKSMDKDARLIVLPNIAGHVGSDITAGLLASDIWSRKGNIIFIDIGTNGEIVFKNENKVYACSTAAGPAFEGASIHEGMRAEEGAIEGVKIEGSRITLEVIGGKEPIGICGSGLIDAIAELLRIGVLDDTGRILEKETLKLIGVKEDIIDHIIETDKGNHFILYQNDQRNIVLTQKDVREVQLAKAAIYAGIVTMLKKASLEPKNITELIVAGAFGNYIKKENAVRIGLLPEIPINDIKLEGNTASLGASMVLLSKKYEDELESHINHIEHIDLAMDADFMEFYIEAMNF